MKNVLFTILLSTMVWLPLTAVSADAPTDQVPTVLTKQSPSIVTVKVVIRTQFKFGGQAQDSESRMELQGAVVSPDGLIMLTGAPFDTKNLSQMLGMQDSSGMEMKTTPTDFKVVIGNEDKEYSAFLAANDTNLGLTFVKIEDLAGRTLQPIDFTSTATPIIDEKVYSVSRLSKGYDYAPYLEAGWVYGQIAKPQAAWILTGGCELGLPVFDDTGSLLGVMAMVPSGVVDTQDSGGAMGMGMLMRLLGGGGGSGVGPMSVFLVPASTVANVITLAKQQAVTVAATRAKAKASAPEKPAPGTGTPASDSAPASK